MARIPGVVVNLRKAGLGGSNQPNNNLQYFRKRLQELINWEEKCDSIPEKRMVAKRNHSFDDPENSSIVSQQILAQGDVLDALTFD